MLSGMLEGERHQTFTESYILPIEELMRLIYVVSDCEIAVNEMVIADIIRIIRFIYKYNSTKVGRKNQTDAL